MMMIIDRLCIDQQKSVVSRKFEVSKNYKCALLSILFEQKKYITKETPAQVLSFEFLKNSKEYYFEWLLLLTCS